MSFTIRRVSNVCLHLVNLAIKSLLSSWMLVVEGGQLLSSSLIARTVVHKGFDSLFAVAANFHFIQRGINHLSVDSLKFTVISKINFHVLVF